MALGYRKAKAVFNKTKDEGNRIVIGSEVVLVKNTVVYGIPKNREDLIRMFKELKKSRIEVIASLAVLIQDENDYKDFMDYDITSINLKNVDIDQINKYIENNSFNAGYDDDAQTNFCDFLEKIIGSYMEDLGLPLDDLYDVIYPYLKNV